MRKFLIWPKRTVAVGEKFLLPNDAKFSQRKNHHSKTGAYALNPRNFLRSAI